MTDPSDETEDEAAPGHADAGSADDTDVPEDEAVDDDADERGEDDAPGEAGGDDPDAGAPAGMSWPRVAVLGTALAFLEFAVALYLTHDQPPGADSVDEGFYQDMISHHEQALELSSLALTNADDPTARSFAAEVLTFQSMEIGMMERTLNEWGTSRRNRSETVMAWMGMPTPVESMPGMATEEQMAEMRAARGAEADALFLELMAAHHVGGVHMAEFAESEADDESVRELAARMAYNQAVEINEYAMTAERLGLPVEIDTVTVPPEPTH